MLSGRKEFGMTETINFFFFLLLSYRNMSIHKVGIVKQLKHCVRSGLLGVNTRRYIGTLMYVCVCVCVGGGSGGIGQWKQCIHSGILDVNTTR